MQESLPSAAPLVGGAAAAQFRSDWVRVKPPKSHNGVRTLVLDPVTLDLRRDQQGRRPDRGARWCRREANPDDRRSSLLVLTDSGWAELAASTPTFRAAMAEQVAGLPQPTPWPMASGGGALLA